MTQRAPDMIARADVREPVREPRWAAWLLGLLLFALLAVAALDPAAQLFFRDTGRNAYPYKKFIAEQLRAGASPFWNPWTEAGTSVLTQVTPGLFHPLTLLYLLLPFELAFKLNHLLAIPLAFAAMYLLARRLCGSRWVAAAAACAYAGSGYFVSVTASNLAYALGAATVPLALHGLLRAAERFSPGRLLWASFALALCVYAGDPQSALVCALIGAGWVIGRDRNLRSMRIAGAWALCGALLAAPAALPVVPRLMQSGRVRAGLGAWDRTTFSNTPSRLLGVVLPWAFDDRQDVGAANRTPPYAEYFSRGGLDEAFATSITLGAPILLLAAASRRRGAWALAAGVLLLLATTGDSFGAQRALFLLPGMRLFRFAEKLIAPASLLLCLAGAIGAVAAIRDRRRVLVAGAVTAAVLVTLRLSISLLGSGVREFLRAHGRTHGAFPADWFLGDLGDGLLAEAGLCAVVVAATLLRPAVRGPAMAVACAAAAVTQASGLLYTMPLEMVHAPALLAQEMTDRAGPSAGRWRMRGFSLDLVVYNKLDPRISRAFSARQILNPQYHQLVGIESVSAYSSLLDPDYDLALESAPSALAQVMGVRFDVKAPDTLSAAAAQELGYVGAAFGAWVKEMPPRPRAFLASCAVTATRASDALRLLQSRQFRVESAVVRKAIDLPCPGSVPGEVALARPAADHLRATVDAPARQLLVIAEHFDPGWRATIDGSAAEVLQADLSALAVVVPQGTHVVELRYLPRGLALGLALAGLTAATLLGIALWRSPRFSALLKRGDGVALPAP